MSFLPVRFKCKQDDLRLTFGVGLIFSQAPEHHLEAQ
jgi:hypothetical protein